MLIEDQSTKCPNCKKPLTWISHTKRWDRAIEIDEFAFQCDSCKGEYTFKDDKLFEKHFERFGSSPLLEKVR